MRVRNALFGLWPWMLLCAQTPPPPVAPTLILLCRGAVKLDADVVRSRWGRILDTKVSATEANGAWLQADGDTLIGGRDGLRFSVRQGPERPIEASAVEHLDDEAPQRLREHKVVLEIAILGALPTSTSRGDAYRLLGGVAVALGARSVLGLGAADYQTFEVAPPPAALRAVLLGDDLLGWLRPTQSSSLVILAKQRSAFNQADLEAKLGKEFGVDFAGDEEAEEFVVVHDATTAVQVGGDLVLLTWEPANEALKAQGERHPELRLRKALGEHEAVLRIGVIGEPGAAAESARRRRIARIAAALWRDDFLVLSWHCDTTWVAANSECVAQLRSDDPVASTVGSAFVPVMEARDEKAMQAAIEQARREWPTAVAHHRAGGELSAKFPLPTRSGGREHIWVTVTRIEGDVVHGTLANEPVDVAGKKLGDAVRCKVGELSDWGFLRDGKMVGGFTVKVLAEQEARRK